MRRPLCDLRDLGSKIEIYPIPITQALLRACNRRCVEHDSRGLSIMFLESLTVTRIPPVLMMYRMTLLVFRV